jgi:hypothetical protein
MPAWPALSLPALPVSPLGSTAPAAKSEKLRMASEFFKIPCIACHGPHGRGTVIRPAMPTIPDFTTREWQSGRANAQ